MLMNSALHIILIVSYLFCFVPTEININLDLDTLKTKECEIVKYMTSKQKKKQ